MMNFKNAQLKNLEVLIFDCQATHSDPARGDVFEIGWLIHGISKPPSKHKLEYQTETYLVKMPPGKTLPRHIQKITGLLIKDFKTAATKKELWLKILKAAKRTAAKNHMPFCPTVIHFARYEEPFLRSFHKSFSPETEFPFLILCTHEMVRRLLPGLPRKGLRTTAGYFGYALPEFRRSHNHLLGTFHIWHHALDLLAENKHILSLRDLIHWLETPFSFSPLKRVRQYPMTEKDRRELPHLPGVYRMFRVNGDLLYIGKAGSLKHRVNSYFHNTSRHSERILDMLSQAKYLTHSVTGSPLEAALKESDEIKALSPPYNIALRTSKEGPFFFSSDLKRVRDKADRLHRIGPVPTKKYLLSLSVLSAALNGTSEPITRNMMETALATPHEYLPEKRLFRQGIEEFKKINKDDMRLPATFRSLMRFGSLLWKERLEKTVEKQREASEDEETPVLKLEPTETEVKEREIHWCPENISKRLSHMVRVATYLIRRSRWYYLLTESSLSWEEHGGGEKRKNILIIQNGLPHFNDPIPIHDEIPIPPGHKKTNLEKQRNFDIFTYDRMRIVTTEIRRILRHDGRVELRFGPRSPLDSDRLKRVLWWV